jgi:hypothetical protein
MDRKLFLAHLMTYGTLDEVCAVKREWGEEVFRTVLDDPRQASSTRAPGLTGISFAAGTLRRRFLRAAFPAIDPL